MHKYYKDITARIFLLVCLFISFFFKAYSQPLSDSIQVSLLTASPGEEVYEKFGHTALRVKDLKGHTDIVFNYGLFSFNTPHFIYRFVKGETDYQLGITDFQNFIMEYALRGSQVTEQILNLNSSQSQNIFNALIENYQPENRIYRYNFFFDNCSTRPRDIIAKNSSDNIIYSKNDSLKSFRELVYDKTHRKSWLSFSIDFTLGADADKQASNLESLFLPEKLMKAFDNAQFEKSGIPVVKTTTIVVEADEKEVQHNTLLNNPLFVCWSLFGIIFLCSLWEWKRHKIFKPIDTLLFGVAGIAGIILFFLNFVSVHPAVNRNYNCFWLQPFQLFAAFAIWVKSLKNILYYYHFANFVILIALLIGYVGIPQHFNPAFFPLIGILCLRSGLHLLLRSKKIHK